MLGKGMTASFDLREFAMDLHRDVSGMRWLMVGLGFLWAVFTVLLVRRELSPPSLSSTQLVAVTGFEACLGFAIALSVWAAWMGRLGPVSLTIREEGVVFRMYSGRSDLLPWDKMSKGVALLDYTQSPMLPQLTRRLWELRRWNRPPTALTKEAFDAILASAARRGFAISSSFPRNSRWGPCRVIRLSRP